VQWNITPLNAFENVPRDVMFNKVLHEFHARIRKTMMLKHVF